MKPILFNTEMVRAILAGRKTVTRRVVKAPYHIDNADVCRESGMAMHKGVACTHGMPYPDSPYHPGDILWVRETWYKDIERYMYKARYTSDEKFFRGGKEVKIKWRPSIHMPREAARLFLRVTGVRAERLQDIAPEQIDAEGCKEYGYSHQAHRHIHLRLGGQSVGVGHRVRANQQRGGYRRWRGWPITSISAARSAALPGIGLIKPSTYPLPNVLRGAKGGRSGKTAGSAQHAEHGNVSRRSGRRGQDERNS